MAKDDETSYPSSLQGVIEDHPYAQHGGERKYSLKECYQDRLCTTPTAIVVVDDQVIVEAVPFVAKKPMAGEETGTRHGGNDFHPLAKQGCSDHKEAWSD